MPPPDLLVSSSLEAAGGGDADSLEHAPSVESSASKGRDDSAGSSVTPATPHGTCAPPSASDERMSASSRVALSKNNSAILPIADDDTSPAAEFFGTRKKRNASTIATDGLTGAPPCR